MLISFTVPHQPRLDLEMWFAALGSYSQNPWLAHLCIQLAEGNVEAYRLLSPSQYFGPSNPPQFIRIIKYKYYFTDDAERPALNWWRREYESSYMHPVRITQQIAAHIRSQMGLGSLQPLTQEACAGRFVRVWLCHKFIFPL